MRLSRRILEPCTGCEGQTIFQEPLIVWLQGGPGASGTGYGNFMVRDRQRFLLACQSCNSSWPLSTWRAFGDGAASARSAGAACLKRVTYPAARSPDTTKPSSGDESLTAFITSA